MSIFGQVWLWSLAAFVLGVLITWLVLVRPIQTRNRELERALGETNRESFGEGRSQRERVAFASQPQLAPPAPTPAPRESYSPPSSVGVDDRSFAPESSATEGFTAGGFAAGARGFPSAEPDWTEESAASEPHWPERDSLAEVEPAVAAAIPVDPVLEEQPESLPTGSGQISAELDSSVDRANSLFAPASSESSKESHPGTTRDGIRPEPVKEAFPASENPIPDAPMYAFSDGKTAEPAGGLETPLETTQVLPQRSRRESPRGGFDAPEPVRPSMRAIARREPSDQNPVAGGSLFEPVVRPGQAATHEPAKPRAPFGPGSALARPGGGRPSEEFTIKASATAMRYCTPDSPQFARMVAEVWFRSAPEAEHAGFRSLS